MKRAKAKVAQERGVRRWMPALTDQEHKDAWKKKKTCTNLWAKPESNRIIWPWGLDKWSCKVQMLVFTPTKVILSVKAHFFWVSAFLPKDAFDQFQFPKTKPRDSSEKFASAYLMLLMLPASDPSLHLSSWVATIWRSASSSLVRRSNCSSWRGRERGNKQALTWDFGPETGRSWTAMWALAAV